MVQPLASTPTPRALGKANPDIIEALAWLTSPSHIAGEITFLEAAVKCGDTTAPALLRDWRAIRRAQRKLLAAQEEGEG